jgi:hypothetical protein
MRAHTVHTVQGSKTPLPVGHDGGLVVGIGGHIDKNMPGAVALLAAGDGETFRDGLSNIRKPVRKGSNVIKVHARCERHHDVKPNAACAGAGVGRLVGWEK